MANIAELFFQTAAEKNKAVPNDGHMFIQGAQIALQGEELKQKRMHLEQQKQQLVEAKMSKFAEAVEKGQAYTGKAQQNYYNKFLPQYRTALGLQDLISDDALAFNGASEEMIKRQGSLISLVNRGKMTMQDALATYHDPQKMVDMFGGNPDVMNSAPLDRTFTEELNKAEKASEVNKAAMMKQQIDIGSKGPVAYNQKVAGDAAEYWANGKSEMDSSLGELKEVYNALKTGKVSTGGVSTLIPGFNSDAAQTMLNPQMVEMRAKAQGALNGILKQTMGTQFTEKEGIRVLNQIWDDKATPAANARKLQSKITQLTNKQRSMEGQFRKFGGPASPEPTPPDTGAPAPNPGAQTQPQGRRDAHELENPDFAAKLKGRIQTAVGQDLNALNTAAKAYGMSPAQIKTILGIQ